MTEPMITVMIVGPDATGVQSVAADYREFNRLVSDGSISSCPLPPDLRQRGFYAYCDDDGVHRGLPPNRWATHLGHAVLRGPVVLFRASAEGDELSLTDDDVTWLRNYFSDPPTPVVQALTQQERLWWDSHPSGLEIREL